MSMQLTPLSKCLSVFKFIRVTVKVSHSHTSFVLPLFDNLDNCKLQLAKDGLYNDSCMHASAVYAWCPPCPAGDLGAVHMLYNAKIQLSPSLLPYETLTLPAPITRGHGLRARFGGASHWGKAKRGVYSERWSASLYGGLGVVCPQ